MRNLTPGQQAAVNKVRTSPNYQISIALDMDYEWTSSSQVDGSTIGPVKVSYVSGERASIYVYNENFKYSQGVVLGLYIGGAVKISWSYEDEDPIVIFSGIITSIPEVDEWIKVECERYGPAVFPKGRFIAPKFNHIPSPGYSVQFDGATITVTD